MKYLRLKGHYSCVSCEATAHPGEEVLSSFCDSQGGASFWGVAAAGAEMSQTRGSSWGNSRKVLSKLWPDFIELIHGCGCHSRAKKNLFFFCRLGIVCAHVCVDTGVPWSCAVLHTHPCPHTHTQVPAEVSASSFFPLWGSTSPPASQKQFEEAFPVYWTPLWALYYSSHKILKGRYYYHPHFTDEDSETKRGEVTCANSHGRSHNSKCHFGSGTHTLIDIINLRSWVSRSTTALVKGFD